MRFLPLLLSTLLIAPALAQQPKQPERIGMYTTVCNSEQETQQLIDRCKKAGVGTLYPSLCGGSSVLWKTDRENYYPSFKDKLASGYDALAVFIKCAHAADIKVYPSVVCGFAGKMLNEHPDWETRDKKGRPSSQTASPYFAFSIPEARAAKIALFMDLINQYDIDGIFLDECNYPVVTSSEETKYGFYGYDKPLMDACKTCFGFDPAAEPIDSDNWKVFNRMRAESVTAFVRELREAIQKSGKNVRMGGYGDPDADMEMRSCGRDYATWCRRGLIDDFFLAAYEKKIPEMTKVVASVRNIVGNKVRLYSALSPFNEFLKTNEEMVAATRAQLAGKADGIWVYRDDFVDKLNLWPSVKTANDILAAHNRATR